MPILRPANIEGKVHSVLVNGKPERGIATERVQSIKVSYEGFEGDAISLHIPSQRIYEI